MPRPFRKLLLATCIAWTSVSAMRDGLAAAAPAPASFRTDRILVKPKERIQRFALDNLHSQRGIQVVREFAGLGNLQVLKLPAGLGVPEAVAMYQTSGLVAYAEPDYLVKVVVEPNDFNYWNGDLWHLKNVGLYGGTPGADVRAPAAWDTQRTASDLVVAVIDSGVRYTHEDLAPNLWVNPGESGLDEFGNDKRTNGIDDDGNGYIDDVHGINAMLGTGDPNDDHGHGTHVSGTIGGVGNNGVGIAGVAWGVQIMACKFVDATGDGSISDALACMDYARSKGAKIMNASWGSYAFNSVALQDAINSARDSGILFVAAAGNHASDNDAYPFYPASYPYDNIISVAATDRTDNKAWFSNFGAASVHLAAPGSPIFSCWNESDSDYRYMEGTSTAAPQVAGACALVWSRFPNLSHLQVMNRVVLGADPVPSLAGTCLTGGRLNLANAIEPFVILGTSSFTLWMEDAIPDGAWTGSEGGDQWLWVASSPVPFSGSVAHQSALASGLHYHYFSEASATMEVFTGDTLFAHVYLDPENPPREVMIGWRDRCWEHRAFWGENIIDWGANETSNRRRMGDLPPAGQWVRLEVPASLLKLEGAKLTGMCFMLVDGRATWDFAGRSNP